MKTIKILTHSGQFHADDIFATATWNLYFKKKEPKTKLTYNRSMHPEDIAAADIVYDVGGIYNTKKLRFDHHQNDPKLVRKNGIPYAAFGLVVKHIVPELITLLSGETNKKFIAEVFEKFEEKLVLHIDAMDNGKLTYKNVYPDVDVATIDNFFRMCRTSKDVETAKDIDKTFFTLVKFAEFIVENILNYAIKGQRAKADAIAVYKKTKDKRVIVSDTFHPFNFNAFPEPLLTVYQDLRGNWSAKTVETGVDLYDARFYFPESWRGLMDEELEKVTGIPGSMFCHKSGFLIVNKTKEGVLKMVEEAFKILKIK